MVMQLTCTTYLFKEKNQIGSFYIYKGAEQDNLPEGKKSWNPLHVYLEESSFEQSETYLWLNMHRIHCKCPEASITMNDSYLGKYHFPMRAKGPIMFAW